MSQFLPIPAAGTAGLIALQLAHDLGAGEPLTATVAIAVGVVVLFGWTWSDRLPNGHSP